MPQERISTYEIENPRQRYSLIDYRRLMPLLQVRNIQDLQQTCQSRVEENIKSGNNTRKRKWTESIAVGSKGFEWGDVRAERALRIWIDLIH